MEDISLDKISEVLNSPDLMSNLKSIMGQLGVSSAEKPDIVVEESGLEEKKGIKEITEALNSNSIFSSITQFLSKNKAERIALLTALRPFLSDEKKGVLDGILQILKVANILLASNII